MISWYCWMQGRWQDLAQVHKGLWKPCKGLWKPSVTLLGGNSCKTESPFANSHPLNFWLATDKIRGTCLTSRPSELHALLEIYLQVFCMFPYQHNSLSNPELKARKAATGRSVNLSNTCMAHPCRVQVLLTIQCVFLSSPLLNRGMLLTLLYKSGKLTA